MSENDRITKKIKDTLNEILPYLQADNGGVELVNYANHTLKIRFTGTCKSCDMQYHTFKAAIEETIKSRIPEVKNIEIVN